MKSKPLSLLLILTLFIASCKLDNPILPGQPGYVASTPPGGNTTGTGTGTGMGTGAVTAGTYYFKGTIGTQAFNWQVTNNLSGWVMGSVTGSGTGLESIVLNTNASQQQSLDIQFINNIALATGESALTYFNNYIPTGTWNFAVQFADFSTLTKSIYLFYTDSNGNFYTNADVQTGSVTVVSVTPMAANSFFSNSLKITFTINNCVLNPQDATLSPVTLSNASATVLLED
jgi:hypothetical protein